MSQSATPVYRFPLPAALPLEASFDGGRLTSDGGLPWLDQAETGVGICAAFAGVIPDWRRGPVRHSLPTLVRQRVFQIACGYEDQDDADALRTDPLLKLVCGRLPESGRDLASQPTLSRLENAVDRKGCYRLAVALGEIYLRERERAGVPTHLILDRGILGIIMTSVGLAVRTSYEGMRASCRGLPSALERSAWTRQRTVERRDAAVAERQGRAGRLD